ncbi:unknown [Roseburia sp. CAG:197]|nr:unknown [Roseburia sp. CAG:197]
MKFSLFHNDKSTVKDELLLFLFIAFWLVCGILLVVYKPSFFIIDEAESTVFGVLCILIAAMFTPGLVYRLFTNDK